jgi:hypothetical protein
MGALVFECPKTNRLFRSDIHTDLESLKKVRHLRARIHCPICHEVHELTVKHSQVEDDLAEGGARRQDRATGR